MRSPSSILIYGRDIRLLETRCWVLEHAGFEVSTTSDLEEAIACIDGDFVALFILCHTLSADECTRILANIHSLHPRTKTLILSTSRSGCESDEDFIMRGFASPQALVSAVSKLTNRSPVPV